MPHYKTFFDSDYLGSWDLEEIERDAVGIIASVQGVKLKNPQGDEDAKLAVVFSKTFPRLPPKPLACNVTNAKAIAGMYGKNTDGWIGKPIAMYVTEIQAFGKTTDCIRVRPTPPKPRKQAPPNAPPAELPPRNENVRDAEVEPVEGGDHGAE